ncbi:MAG: DUF620 domain-containing protein [Pirellulaceae bacterium]|nr:DUF620 domain-containing protein [Pirellulaceae bacterium]
MKSSKSSTRQHSLSNRFQGLALATALACSLALFTGTGTNVIPAAEKELPSAEEIIDRNIAATGGKEAYDKINNRVIKGTMEITGQGIKLSLSVYAAKPNLVRAIIESDVTGKIESGTDGTVVWENSLLKGPAIKSGVERSNALRDSIFDRLVYWTTAYGAAECVGKQAIDGNMCFKIVLTPKPPQVSAADQEEGEPLTVYIDEKTNLVAKIESKVVTAAGTIPVEAYLRDYKMADGLLISHQLVMKILGQERVQNITSISHNVELPKDRFALHEQIQALVDKE